MKFTEGCVICTEKYVLVKKCLQMAVRGAERHWLSGKEKFQGAAVTWKPVANSLGKIQLIYWMSRV